MTDLRVSVVEPLTAAWERTRRLLFRPFDLARWLVLGFSAWLAGLGGGGRGFNVQVPLGGWDDSSGWGERLEGAGRAAHEAWASALAAGCLVLLVVGCLFGIALALALLWVSSRAKFVFLDNVLHERAQIREPWKRFRRQGDSLFLFRLLFGLTFLALAGLALGGIVLAAGGIAALERVDVLRGTAAVGTIVALAAVIVLLLLAAGLVAFFLDAFVVPLMHRYELGVLDAWRRFLAIFRARPWSFLLAGLLLLALGLAVGAAVFAAGLLTCCLGFLVLMIPYVGTVLLLPVPVFYRAYTVELLARTDPELIAGPTGDPGGR